MLARNVNQADVEGAAHAVGLRVVEFRCVSKTAVRFRLSLGPAVKRGQARRYQRTSTNFNFVSMESNQSRRIAAVCWHGHRDFFREIFKIRPDARIQTTLLCKQNHFNVLHDGLTSTRWYTAENFESIYPSTDRNIGSPIAPVLASEACLCGHEVRFASGRLEGDRLVESDVRQIKQSDLLRCPFVIIVPKHYRPDGSCRCDDPEHRAMMIREWGYAEEDFQ